MGFSSSLAFGLAVLLFPATVFAVDCSPFQPDGPVEQSAETEIKAEVGGLLARLVEIEGDDRVAEAQQAFGSDAEDPDGLAATQSKLFYFCQALTEAETISVDDQFEIMRGIMDARHDAQMKRLRMILDKAKSST